MILPLQIGYMAQSASSVCGKRVQEFPKITSPTVSFSNGIWGLFFFTTVSSLTALKQWVEKADFGTSGEGPGISQRREGICPLPPF